MSDEIEPGPLGLTAKAVAEARQHGCHYAEGTCDECAEIADAAIRTVRKWEAENGFVTVPREPTEAMLISARDWSLHKYGKAVGNDGASGCWNAMIAAALPDPPQSKEHR